MSGDRINRALMSFLYAIFLRSKHGPEKCLKRCDVTHRTISNHGSLPALKSRLIFSFVLWVFQISRWSASHDHGFILIGKKVNEVLTAIITHLTFTPLQLGRPSASQLSRSADVSVTVSCQALLPIPLLEINRTTVGPHVQ